VLPLTIRRATSGDENAILDVLGEAFEPYRAQYTPGAYADTVLTPEALRQRLLSMTVLMAVDGAGCVVGTVAYNAEPPGEGHMRGMAVRPVQHGSGVARALLAQVESDLRALQCTALTLDTVKPLVRAKRFYESNGFRATGEVQAFFGMELMAYRKAIT
jgi:GNAT superfamily N-acetyltransferase